MRGYRAVIVVLASAACVFVAGLIVGGIATDSEERPIINRCIGALQRCTDLLEGSAGWEKTGMDVKTGPVSQSDLIAHMEKVTGCRYSHSWDTDPDGSRDKASFVILECQKDHIGLLLFQNEHTGPGWGIVKKMFIPRTKEKSL